MLKGIATVLLRVMGVWFCLTAILQLPWTITAYGAMGDQTIQQLAYVAGHLTGGVFLIVFSTGLADKCVPRPLTDDGAAGEISSDMLVSAGTALIALFVVIDAIADFIPSLLHLISYTAARTVEMSQDHDAEYFGEGTAFFKRFDYLISSVAKMVLAAILLILHPRIARWTKGSPR